MRYPDPARKNIMLAGPAVPVTMLVSPPIVKKLTIIILAALRPVEVFFPML